MELLATTDSQSYVSSYIPKITKYKYLVLNCCSSNTQRVLASTIIPVDAVKNSLGSDYIHSASFKDASQYEASIYFTSTTECYLKSKSMYDHAILYGII